MGNTVNGTNIGVTTANINTLEGDQAKLNEEFNKAFVAVADASDNMDTFVSTTAKADNNANTPQEVDPSEYTFEKAKDVAEFIKKCEAEIEKIIKQMEANEAEIEKLQKERADKQAQYDQLKEQYDENKQEIENLTNSKNAAAQNYESIEQAIEAAAKELKTSFAEEQKQVMTNAMRSYNKEEDGDYASYLQEKLKGVVPDESLQLLIKSLTGQGENIASSMVRLNSDISNKTEVGNNLNLQLETLANEIDNLDTQISTKTVENQTLQATAIQKQSLETKAVLASISEAEKCLAKQNNIDLTETFDDGTPKYIIAPGKQDGKLHIYERESKDSKKATSLARKYGGGNGRLKGLDIVKMGNGFMKITNDCLPSDSKKGTSVYNFSEINSELTDGTMDIGKKQYCTYSPLSFDLNGDGVRTSNKLVKFDIDGDGILDTINDSADAVLVFDKDGDGISGEDGSECFGDNTDLDGDGKADGYKNGFEALKALAKKENLIDGKNDNSLDEKDLKVLEEKYGLKIKTKGYLSDTTSLFDAGITRIDFSTSDKTTTQKNFDGKNNDLMTQEGANFIINGQKRTYADIWHTKKNK